MSLQAIAAEAQHWLFNAAAPLWATAGRLDDGLFAEAIGRDGGPVLKTRRMKVQARQIYSLCELGRLGWNGPWRSIAEDALGILMKTARRGDGLFVHEIACDGSIADARADLMDHAFILFALGSAAMALERPDLVATAHEVMDLIERSWSNPFGGLNEGEAVTPEPRRQNPHMHMFEAMLALHDASGEQRWRLNAEKMAELGRTKFIDRESGAVREYFTPDWKPVAGPDGETIEPGHCFEWAWLMQRDPQNSTRTRLADGLIAFARRHGIDQARNVAIYEVMIDGTPKDRSARLWAQTERLKAALARWRRTQDAGEAREAVAAYRGLEQYFNVPVHGSWLDRLLPNGEFIDEPAPASSLYHIVCALSELITTARSFPGS